MDRPGSIRLKCMRDLIIGIVWNVIGNILASLYDFGNNRCWRVSNGIVVAGFAQRGFDPMIYL
jgi:hypothetical protein